MAKNNKKLQDFSLDDFELNETDKQVFKFQLQYPEISQRQLCKLIGVNETQLSRIVNKPAYKKAKAEFDKNWIDILLEGKHKAARKILQLVDNGNPRIALDASKSILQLDDIKRDGDKADAVLRVEYVS
ncbi:hypothetical protein [Flavobacterium filum]|uniref:hypothetical protein n=1 Tax=Flavobacterium filum TaxID=370974 RepID=UPI0023F3CC35|nr:hypothetical protein [Flavobacterium filum]